MWNDSWTISVSHLQRKKDTFPFSVFFVEILWSKRFIVNHDPLAENANKAFASPVVGHTGTVLNVSRYKMEREFSGWSRAELAT